MGSARMIYVLAIVFSFVFAVLTFVSAITTGNIGHLQNGREPKATAAIFPTIPLFQIVAVAAAWIFQRTMGEYAIWVLTYGFLGLIVI